MIIGSNLEVDHVQKHLWRHDEHVGRDTVAGHAIFALLDRLVEAELLLLRDGVHHYLVVHSRADVALGAKVLAAVCQKKDRMGLGLGLGGRLKGPMWFKPVIVTVIEVVVAAGEVLRTSKEMTSQYASERLTRGLVVQAASAHGVEDVEVAGLLDALRKAEGIACKQDIFDLRIECRART